jgi:hypothetical protein
LQMCASYVHVHLYHTTYHKYIHTH